VDACDWTGTFYADVIGAHLSSRRSDTKEVWVNMVYERSRKFQLGKAPNPIGQALAEGFKSVAC
jgi:hypothetical protein